MKIILHIFIFLMLCIPVVFSQKITNVRATQEGNKISVYYDLNEAFENQLFDIKLYCSTDNGTTWGYPLQSVSNDVGTGISSGVNKKIIWDVLSEKNELKSNNVKFEIRATFSPKIAESVSGIFTDPRDNQQYKWIKIGNQIWMAQNLNYNSSSGSWCYDDNSANCTNFGKLYSFNAALTVCPNGWHLPSDAEWKNFEHATKGKGTNLNIGDIIVITGKSTDLQEINKFNVILSGWRSYKGNYYRMGFTTNFWTSTFESNRYAWSRKIDDSNRRIYRDSYDIESGFSVRCVKD